MGRNSPLVLAGALADLTEVLVALFSLSRWALGSLDWLKVLLLHELNSKSVTPDVCAGLSLFTLHVHDALPRLPCGTRRGASAADWGHAGSAVL